MKVSSYPRLYLFYSFLCHIHQKELLRFYKLKMRKNGTSYYLRLANPFLGLYSMIKEWVKKLMEDYWENNMQDISLKLLEGKTCKVLP